MPVGEVIPAMPGPANCTKADSQLRSKRPQKREAICVDKIRA
jgi:hypothetical protein